jgi:hypothetical protein
MNINSKQINNQEEGIMLNIDYLKDCFFEHLWIKISEQDKKEAEVNTLYYANQTARNYAYFNYLSNKLFRKFVEEHQGIESNYQLFDNDNNLARTWQFINGSVVNINEKRLILIPSDATDLEGFEVQKEWVDVPNLAGDYYLPVRVDLERNYLHIWGFISRENLKKRADYDELNKLYIVNSDDVIDNLESLWIALELCEEKGDVEVLPSLTESEAAKLIETYSQPSRYSPRLQGNSQKWMGLLNEEKWLRELDLEMLIKSPDRPLVIFLDQLYQKESAEVKTQPTINKQEKAIYRSGLSIPSKIEKHRGLPVDGIILDTKEKIDQAINNLLAKYLRVESKPEIVPANLELYDILLELLLKGKKKISGQAAEIFWAIASYLPSPKTTAIHTDEIKISGHLLSVNIACIKVSNRKNAVLLRVHSQSSDSLLPNGMKLQLMIPDAQDNYIPEGRPEVANQQNCIQLYFCADLGDKCACEIKIRHEKWLRPFAI